ncbi:MAG: M20/M25/M40 family metallo-hydrolase [bacterium]
MKKFDAYVDANRERFISELQELCRQPSIAAQNVGVLEMADLVRAKLEILGARVRLMPTEGGPPVVFAEIGEGERTLMFYNHYDVQPPEPLELWDSEPFVSEIRDGKVFARGVSDNKGELMARIAAVETYRKVFGELPLKVKFVVEGEEEVGSPHLARFAEKNKDILAADGCIWESGGKDEAERFTIYLGLKGIMYFELRVKCAKRDIHSSYATLVPNPAWRLVWALSTIKDEDDNITIDGYMDHVAEPTPEEMEMLRAIPFEEEKIKENFGIPAFIRNLKGIEALKKHLYQPTCTICGFKSGYIGEGSKTVLPNEAVMKLDLRLVPNLTPEIATNLLRRHLDRRGFTDIEMIPLSGERPAKSPPDAPIVRTVVAAARDFYGKPPVVYPTLAGSGPMYPLSQALGIPAVGVGVGYPGSNAHAPNENIRIDDFIEGIKFMGEVIRRFSEFKGTQCIS